MPVSAIHLWAFLHIPHCNYFYQVADQQGKYLGHLLTTTDGDVTKQSVLDLQKAAIRPFEYHHFGSFAYVGDNKAVLQMPVIGMDDVECVCVCGRLGNIIFISLYSGIN